jgi:hypothetical protein
MASQLDKLYIELSDLRAKERRGQNVKANIERVLAEINLLESPIQVEVYDSSQPHQDYQSYDFNTQGDAIGNAVGPNASVEAEVIANHYNPQQFSNTTNQNVQYNSSPTAYGPHPAHTEVIAGDIVSGWFKKAFYAAPKGVSIGLATILPVLFLLSEDTIIVGIIGLLTITPIGIYVLLQTRFLNIPHESYRENKLLYYATWFMMIIGVLSVILFVISYYLVMTILSAVMGAMREQI